MFAILSYYSQENTIFKAFYLLPLGSNTSSFIKLYKPLQVHRAMKLSFIPLDYDYKDINGRTIMIVYGKTKEGKRLAVLDEVEEYFYILSEQPEALIKKFKKDIKAEIVQKNFLEKPVKAIKVYAKNHSEIKELSDKIKLLDSKAERKEIDINIITRYIVDKKLSPLLWYEVEGPEVSNSLEYPIGKILDTDLVIKAEKIKKIDEEPAFKPKILAYDIETSEFELGKGEILMISLVSDNFKKVLTWKPQKAENVENYKSEDEMIEAFIKHIKQIKPDILVGYFSDAFDLPYLRMRANKFNIKLDISLDGSQPRFSHGRMPSTFLAGIVHVDLYKFIQTNYSQYLSSETLSLDEVSRELLGEGKLEFEKKDGKKLEEHEWKDFYAYNLQDSILTYKLCEKSWPDIAEFTKIVQEPLQDVVRNSMSQHVEDYLIHNLERFNEIAERKPIHDEIGKRREFEKYEGAFVFQPTPGLYNNLATFDFTSMYSSVIVSFNLSLSTFSETKQKGYTEVELEKGKKVYFSQKKGFFSTLLEEIIKKRKKYKEEYKKAPDPVKKARSNAYKLLANASYGYQGFFGARYYCREAAASTAALARKSLKETIDKINNEGYKVIYADTDGISFLLNEKTKSETRDFLSKLNKELPGVMELDLEDFYKRGLWVTKRTGEFGAKKKYALITENNKIRIRGFETVRRDWCQLARNLQSEVIELILKEGNADKALQLFKKKIKELKERKIDKEGIMIRTQLKKPINEYKSISPHVIAAKKMQELGEPIDIGMLIRFFIAEVRSEKSKKLVREKVKLPEEKGEYNIKYYLEHQLIPAVENIFEVFNINVKEVADGNRQKKLF